MDQPNQKDDNSSVRVAVRVRPLIGREKVDRCEECVNALTDEAQIVIGKDRSFAYDYVYSKYSQQSDLWDSVGPLVDANFQGYNATIFAYGQTGSGKTFTMGSGSNVNVLETELGIIPRVISNMFKRAEENKEAGYAAEFKISFMEIYGEEIRDLLDPFSGSGGSKVTIREDENGSVQVIGATEEPVESEHACLRLLEKGTLHRTTGSTLMNAHSSRSHAVFTLSMVQHIPKTESIEEASQQQAAESPTEIDEVEIRSSYFHFVDLAGSERQKRTQAEGKRLKEGIEINKGLLALGNVISALGDEKKRGKVHVPYRDSKLTRMLQDSLGGNSRTLMFACVSPADYNFEETLNALKYAHRARNIQNCAVINRDPTSAIVSDLRQQVRLLQAELNLRRKDGGDLSPMANASVMLNSVADQSELQTLRNRAETAEAEVLRLTNELKKMKLQMETINQKAIVAQTDYAYSQLLLEESQRNGNPEGAECNPSETEVKKRGILQSQLERIAELESKLRAAESENEVNRIHRGSTPSAFSCLDNNLLSLAEAEIEKESRMMEMLTREDSLEVAGDGTKAVDGDDSGDGTDEAEEAEMHRIFEKRQRQLGSTVQDLSTNISLKEQLVKDLKRSQANYEQMKRQYEKKMEEMVIEVKQAQSDRDKLLCELRSIESKQDTGKSRRQELLSQIKEKDAKLHSLQKKQRELQKLSQLKNKSDQEIRQLYTDISNMKRTKVELIRKMQKERQKYEEEAKLRSREIQSLKRKSQKERREFQKLESQKEAHDRVMRRKLEQVTQVNRRLKERTKGYGTRRAAKAVSAEEEAKKIKLAEQIEKLAMQKEKQEKLDKELQQREAIIENMERLHGLRDKMQNDQLEIATNSQPAQSIRDVLISPNKDTRSSKQQRKHRPLTADEEQAMFEVEERIEACQAQLDYKEDRISEMASSVQDEEEKNQADENDIEKVKDLPEARTLLKILFDMAVSHRSSDQKNQQQLEENVRHTSELEDEIQKKEEMLQQMRLNNDQDLTRLRKRHEEKLSFYMDYYNSMQDTSAVPTEDTIPTSPLAHSPKRKSRSSSFDGRNSLSPSKFQTPESKKTKALATPSSSRSDLMFSMAKERNSVLRKQCDQLENSRLQLEREVSELKDKEKELSEQLQASRQHVQWLEGQLTMGSPERVKPATSPSSVQIEMVEDHECEDMSPKMEKKPDSPDPEEEKIHRSIFQRLASPNNFTGIHKHRKTENIRKKDEIKYRGNKLRARRLKDKANQAASGARPATAPQGIRSWRQEEFATMNKKISSVHEVLDKLRMGKSIESPEATGPTSQQTVKAESTPEGGHDTDVYTRLAGQYTACSQNKRWKSQPQRASNQARNQRRSPEPQEETHISTTECSQETPDTTTRSKDELDPLLGVDRLSVRVHDDFQERLTRVE